MLTHSNILFILGILGILFYVVGPVFFPHVPNIRQPELLPVYSLMLGLGGLLRRNAAIEAPKAPGHIVPVVPPDMTPKEGGTPSAPVSE